jgi:hypothetical protein
MTETIDEIETAIAIGIEESAEDPDHHTTDPPDVTTKRIPMPQVVTIESGSGRIDMGREDEMSANGIETEAQREEEEGEEGEEEKEAGGAMVGETTESVLHAATEICSMTIGEEGREIEVDVKIETSLQLKHAADRRAQALHRKRRNLPLI